MEHIISLILWMRTNLVNNLALVEEKRGMEASLSESALWDAEEGLTERRANIDNLNSTAFGDISTTKTRTVGERELMISPIPRLSEDDNNENRVVDESIESEEGSSSDADQRSLSPAMDSMPFDNTNTHFESTRCGAADSNITDENIKPGTSTPERTPQNRRPARMNPFEKHLLERLHSNTFSPSVFSNVPPTPETPEHGAVDFKWSIEQLALLKPANITDEEIANSSISPDPIMEAKYRAAADIYWSSGMMCIPSPEGPRPQFVETPQMTLSEIVRLWNAARMMTASTSATRASPLKRPASCRQLTTTVNKRHCSTQTTCTIGPWVDFDFASVLGESSVFSESAVEQGEEFEANVSVGSVNSLRRRLFAADDSYLTEDNSAFPSADCSQNFNDDDIDLLLPLPDEAASGTKADLGGDTPRDSSCLPHFDLSALSPIKFD